MSIFDMLNLYYHKATPEKPGRQRCKHGRAGQILRHTHQHVNLRQAGHDVQAVEIIGHLRPFLETPSQDISSRAGDSSGNTLDYVYEMEGDTLIIWGAEKGSPACFKGKFSDNGKTNIGEWV
jgi:hypothetical protein